MVRRIVAGNWKMNTTLSEGVSLVREIGGMLAGVPEGVELLVCPPYTHLGVLSGELPARVSLGAQDCSAHAKGAYTGEVSAGMLRDAGARYVIVGHSERRMYHNEGDEVLLSKAHAAHGAGLQVIFCVGEPLSVRDGGDESAWGYVQGQLAVLGQLPEACLRGLIVAYEPIWAIGTGLTATPEQAGAMCRQIVSELARRLQVLVPVLYGGSCNAGNAAALFGQEGISGGLIGGASLKAADYVAIACSF